VKSCDKRMGDVTALNETINLLLLENERLRNQAPNGNSSSYGSQSDKLVGTQLLWRDKQIANLKRQTAMLKNQSNVLWKKYQDLSEKFRELQIGANMESMDKQKEIFDLSARISRDRRKLQYWMDRNLALEEALLNEKELSAKNLALEEAFMEREKELSAKNLALEEALLNEREFLGEVDYKRLVALATQTGDPEQLNWLDGLLRSFAGMLRGADALDGDVGGGDVGGGDVGGGDVGGGDVGGGDVGGGDVGGARDEHQQYETDNRGIQYWQM
jgi:hypothetical protein